MKGQMIRKNKLKNSNGFYFVLAIDHQLSSGYVKNVSEVKKWLDFANNSEQISGIVLNKGGLNQLPNDFSSIIIPQLIGSPSLFGRIAKTQMISVENALFYGADIVSIQVNFEDKNYLNQFKEISGIIEKSNSLGLPVLCMINLLDFKNLTTNLFFKYVKICDEIGSDFIKINLPNDAKENIKEIQIFLKNSIPVLLAGGGSLVNFIEVLKTSKECGFSGVCIGRNLVNNPDYLKITNQICDIFQT